MSRLSHKNIWQYHIGAADTAWCLCCKKTVIHRAGKDWVRGHIIPHKNQGPDIYENVRPICRQCNIDDKKYDDNFAYMVAMGKMTPNDRKERLAEIVRCHLRYMNDRGLLQCHATTAEGNPCGNKSLPRRCYCQIHIAEEVNDEAHMERILQWWGNRQKATYIAIGRIDPCAPELPMIAMMQKESTLLLFVRGEAKK